MQPIWGAWVHRPRQPPGAGLFQEPGSVTPVTAPLVRPLPLQRPPGTSWRQGRARSARRSLGLPTCSANAAEHHRGAPGDRKEARDQIVLGGGAQVRPLALRRRRRAFLEWVRRS